MADDFLCMKEVEKVVSLALPLTYIRHEKIGVLEILESWKRQYNHQLEGILISYNNVSILPDNVIVNEKYCVQIRVKAKFNLFCPIVGSIVKGKINRISKEHVGCLVHDIINVVIKLREYCPPELNKFIRLEQEILFEIANFCVRRTEISMKGKITPDCLRLMNDFFPVTEEEITNFSFQKQNCTNQYDFNDMELDLMDIKQEKITSPSSSDIEGEKTSDETVIPEKLTSTESIVEKLFGKKKKNRLLKVHSNGVEPFKSGKKRKRRGTDDEISTDDVGNCSQLSGEVKTKMPKLDLSLPPNHVVKKKKRKKDKEDKKKSHKSKKKPKLAKKGKTVASGEILKKDKKKHKNKHKDNRNKLKSKSSKKHSKKKKSKHTNDVTNDISVKSEH